MSKNIEVEDMGMNIDGKNFKPFSFFTGAYALPFT